jgi:hypothetical protein
MLMGGGDQACLQQGSRLLEASSGLTGAGNRVNGSRDQA